MWKKIVFTGLAVLTVIIIHASCIPSSRTHVPASISFLTGTVLVNGYEATLGKVVLFGDIIETRTDSMCSITLDGKNIIGMRPDTSLVFNIKGDDALLSLKKGFLGIIIKNRKNIDNFRVNTPTVTASVRGTSFFIGVEQSEKVYTCICNGIIHYHGDGHEKSVRNAAANHKAAYFTRRGGGVSIDPGTLKYHDDQDMEKLASQIDVRIDWTRIEE
jgi:ferric-dicitrate binding protein FerR (iron transport regulator)